MKQKTPDADDGEETRKFCGSKSKLATPDGHRVTEKGEILRKRYIIQEKLGEGVFSKVWRAKDTKHEKDVAIKIIRRPPGYQRAARKEMNTFKTVADLSLSTGSSPPIVQLLNAFSLPGGFTCLVFDRFGSSLLSLVENRQNMVPIPIAKSILRQLLEALDFLHTKCNTIHSDIKPENILMRRKPSKSVMLQRKIIGVDVPTISVAARPIPSTRAKSTRIIKRKKCHCCAGNECHNYIMPEKRQRTTKDGEKWRPGPEKVGKGSSGKRTEAPTSDLEINLADLGTSFHVTDQNQNFGIQTREYRCPESILQCGPYLPAADIWSVACVAFELWTGDFLFRPPDDDAYDHSGDDTERDIAHLMSISELLGPIPATLLVNCKQKLTKLTHRFEHINQRHTIEELIKQKSDGRDGMNFEGEVRRFAAFLEPMLALNPARRATAAECLKHPWLKESF